MLIVQLGSFHDHTSLLVKCKMFFVYLLYLGLEGPIFLCAIFHIFESSQIVIADDSSLQKNIKTCKELSRIDTQF